MRGASRLIGDQLLCGVLVNFKNNQFRTSEGRLLAVFCEALKRPLFREFAGTYVFDPDSPEPWSEKLSHAFGGLIGKGVSTGVDFQAYTIDSTLRDRYNKTIKPKLGQREELLRRLAGQIENSLAKKQPVPALF